jgi:multiple antibiotic resistance protein
MVAVAALSVWLAMRFALLIHRLLTGNGVELVTRISGFPLAAIAVQLVANSAIAFARGALKEPGLTVQAPVVGKSAGR